MVESILEAIHQVIAEPTELPRLAQFRQTLESADPKQFSELVTVLSELVESGKVQSRRLELEQALQPIFHGLFIALQRYSDEQAAACWNEQQPTDFEKIYLWARPESSLRCLMLGFLATGTLRELDSGQEPDQSLRIWVNLIGQDPPHDSQSLQVAFGPLMQRHWNPPPWMLESLIEEGTKHSSVAPAIFDLFNFYYRTRAIAEHPAANRANELTELLDNLVLRMLDIESGNVDRSNPELLGRQVNDAVAMLVALCDSLALIKHQGAAESLGRALRLKHRRVQTEAAAALAMLGVDEGREALIRLAEEPSVRLRVLAYAEELGIENEISLELRGEIARAESRLAIWLAEPAQVGIAPSNVLLIDSREMYWPSYEHPVQCYLFKYTFGTDENSFSNVGICGPLTHAFPNDLMHLSVDDMYAAFAGWQTTHPEVYRMSPETAEKSFGNEWRRIKQTLASDLDLEEANVETVGSFFGQLVLIASGKSNTETPPASGTIIADAEQTCFIDAGSEQAPIDAELAYAIWRGRQLLSTFNPE